ncbi:MAG TPA: hypothetical protein VFZ00_01490 [Solirubrobacter sp.]|nr:hypothetical protein [Solirubrobacter sp.]
MPASEHENVATVVRREMAEQRLTFRALRERTRLHDEAGRGLSDAYLVALAKGQRRGSQQALDLLARALGVNPWRFTEYRLAYYRRALDERPPPEGVGPELAAIALRLVEEAMAPLVPGEDPVDVLEREFQQAGLLPPTEPVRRSTAPAGEPPSAAGGARP